MNMTDLATLYTHLQDSVKRFDRSYGSKTVLEHHGDLVQIQELMRELEQESYSIPGLEMAIPAARMLRGLATRFDTGLTPIITSHLETLELNLAGLIMKVMNQMSRAFLMKPHATVREAQEICEQWQNVFLRLDMLGLKPTVQMKEAAYTAVSFAKEFAERDARISEGAKQGSYVDPLTIVREKQMKKKKGP